MIAKITSFIDLINEWAGRIVSLWVIILMGIIVYEVFMRRLLNSPTIWVHELSLYIFGAMWVLAGGYALKHNAMVNMDLFYGRLSEKRKALIDLITIIAALIFCAVLLWKSAGMAWSSIEWREMSDTIWHVPLYPIRLTVPIGTALLLVQVISKFMKDLIIWGKSS